MSAAMHVLRCAGLVERSGTQAMRAGQKWRLSHALPRSGNEFGSHLFSLPDWEFADGRPAPQRASVRRAVLREERKQQRIARLQSEMDVLLQSASEKRTRLQEQQQIDAEVAQMQQAKRAARLTARKAFFAHKLRKKIGVPRV